MIGRASFPRIISRSFASAQLKPLVATEQFPFSAKLSPTKAGPVVVKESKLASGVKIISKDDGINNIVHFKVAVLGGSRAETAEQKGAAHFLAAGAWNAGNALNSGLRTVRYMESVGAQIASSGDREKIVFDVVAEANKADLVFAGIAAAVSTPPDAMYKYSEDVRPIADERYKVLKEHHWAQVMEQLHEAAYGETAPLGGSKYALSLDLLDVEQVVAYRNAHFVADNLVVAASGISHEKLTALVEQYVGTGRKLPRASTDTEIELHLLQVPSAATPTPNPLAGASPYEGGVSKVRLDLHGESHLGLGYPIAAGDAAKPFLVLQGLLAQKFGAEEFHTYHYSSGGLATYYASGEPAVAGAKLLAVVAEIKAIAAGGANVEGTKLRVAIDHLSALESDKATDLLLTAHLNGVSAQSFGDVRGVTKEQVVAAAQTVLKSAPAYAVLGTTAHTPSHAAVLAAWKQ